MASRSARDKARKINTRFSGRADVVLLAEAIALVSITCWSDALALLLTVQGVVFYLYGKYNGRYHVNNGNDHVNTERKELPQYQMRLPEDFRAQLEEIAKQDGNASLATWIKRALRKELQSRGIEPKG